MSSSAKRSLRHPSSGVLNPDTTRNSEMGAMPLPVPEDAMEVNSDAGVESALVRRGAKRASTMWEELADQTDMEVCPDTTGECCNCDAVEILSWYATVGGTVTEQVSWCKNARCSDGVTSTKSHPCRQSSARQRPRRPRETKPSREL